MTYGEDSTKGTRPGSAVDEAAAGHEADAPASAGDSSVGSDANDQPGAGSRAANMLPGRKRRRSGVERVMVRSIATGGVVAIGVLIAAILASSNVEGWIIGLVVSGISVILSAVLWSSTQV